MSPEEFKAWQKVWLGPDLPDGVDGEAFSNAAWRALSAKLDRLEREPIEPAERWADAIKWAAFWLALGSVCTALVLR